jgi:hypothetical protein
VLYLGDCRQILPQLPKWGADLIVTDPPYGIDYESNYRTGARLPRMVNDDATFVVPFEEMAHARADPSLHRRRRVDLGQDAGVGTRRHDGPVGLDARDDPLRGQGGRQGAGER